jgi:hypothetical protein
VSEAVTKTVQILFKPFSWRKWVKLIFIGWLAGALSGGMNYSGWDKPLKPSKPAVQQTSSATTTQQVAASNSAEPEAQEQAKQELAKQYEKKYWFENSLLKSARAEKQPTPAWYLAAVVWPVIIGIVLLLLVLMLFFMWLASRFYFAWYHAVKTDEVTIGVAFGRYAEYADSLMLFYISATVLSLCYFGAILFPAGYSVFQVYRISPDLITNVFFLLSNFWPFIALVVFSTIILMIIYTLVADFIGPIMVEEKVYFMEACRLWMPIYTQNRLHVWRYFGMKILASVLGSGLTLALTVPVILLVILAGLILFLPPYLVVMVWLKAKLLFWIVAILLGVPFFMAMIVLLCACALPVSVFMRAYSLSFLGRLRTPEA